MEVLTRIAIQKYFKTKTVGTAFEAIENNVQAVSDAIHCQYDCHEWREKRLWNEECDIVFKYYMPAFKMIYEKNSGKYAKPGMPK